MEYHMYLDARMEWRWKLKAANNRTIADSGEGYQNEADCLSAINLVKGSAAASVKKVAAA